MQDHTDISIAIVDRDRMSGGVLAQALSLQFHCKAATVRESELQQSLASGKVKLVVVGREDCGFELANSISRNHPQVGIVMLLPACNRDAVLKAFRSGAHGVFNRDGASGDFMDCVQRVREGGIWASHKESDFLLEAFRNLPGPAPFSSDAAANLTLRESQVVRSAARGRTNKDIAQELHLSEHTVKNYLFKAFEKLGIKRRVELLLAWPAQGLTHTWQASGGD